ncbi:ABC transporter permease [Rhodoplanes sp. Z2-YC6860]|uniref:ABC transporter permease n=1 Tax=Rhodoplanes sp. Z2-YC6860 TaxID=674703 RepID=UPI00078BEC0C|nr:ABC transporter permease [Rhodoplanes sp. Z2-YC6860]AMN41382.1 ABC transporter permease [Rhodoplanes sp. Z2-YC6860]
MTASYIPIAAPSHTYRKLVAQLALGAAFIASWEAAAVWFLDPFFIGQPSAIAVRLWDAFVHGDMLAHTSVTLFHSVAGLLLSLVIGVPVGVLFATKRRVADTVEPFFLGLYSLPRVALAPLFILWFGIGSVSKIVMAVSMVVFIVILNTHEGLRGVDRDLVDLMKTMRASKLYLFRKVLLPSIVPWIFASLRVGIGLALVGAVIGELLGANRGLGWYVEYSAGRVDINGVFAGLVVLAILGMALNEIVKAIESRVTAGRY